MALRTLLGYRFSQISACMFYEINRVQFIIMWAVLNEYRRKLAHEDSKSLFYDLFDAQIRKTGI